MAVMYRDKRLTPNFWDKVVAQPTGCWEWTGANSGRGYGKLSRGPVKGRIYAHRFAFEHLVGPIPDGLTIDHLCCNRACVNPAHLEPVEHKENVRRGPQVRLSSADVAEIRRLSDEGTTRGDLAEQFGLSYSHTCHIVNGRAWR